MNPEQIQAIGLFDPKRLTAFLQEYRTDTNPASLIQKDALVNHILGLHILHRAFIQKGAIAMPTSIHP